MQLKKNEHEYVLGNRKVIWTWAGTGKLTAEIPNNLSIFDENDNLIWNIGELFKNDELCVHLKVTGPHSISFNTYNCMKIEFDTDSLKIISKLFTK